MVIAIVVLMAFVMFVFVLVFVLVFVFMFMMVTVIVVMMATIVVTLVLFIHLYSPSHIAIGIYFHIQGTVALPDSDPESYSFAKQLHPGSLAYLVAFKIPG
jgi:hypothetical protein